MVYHPKQHEGDPICRGTGQAHDTSLQVAFSGLPANLTFLSDKHSHRWHEICVLADDTSNAYLRQCAFSGILTRWALLSNISLYFLLSLDLCFSFRSVQPFCCCGSSLSI